MNMTTDTDDSGAPGKVDQLVRLPWQWLDERLHLQDLVEFTRHKVVPVGQHSTVWYYFGGVTLFFFSVQILTGILLLMYYQPGQDTSYESMKYLVTKVKWGWLVRSIHCWSAHLMTASLLVHMFSVFFTKAYRRPRELTWFSGIGLYALVLTFGFSGYLLPWNELSYFATAVGTDSVKSVPVVGHWMLRVMRGGDEVTINTLYRFFALHVCILPIFTFGLIGGHVLLVQRQGMASVIEPEGGHKGVKRGMRFVPNFAARDMLLWIVCLNVLGILAVAFPYGLGIPGIHWDLGSKADPLMPAYPGIKPEWYFLWIYQLLREFPAHVGALEGAQVCLAVVNVLMTIWLVVPIIDLNAKRDRESPAFTDFGAAAVFFLVFLTLKAWDIGVSVPHGEDAAGTPENLAIIARTAAHWTIGLAVAATALRWFVLRSRFLIFSIIVIAQVVANGYLGVSYIASGAVCSVAAVLVAAVLFRQTLRARSAAAAAPAGGGES
jgi:cytochrome b6